MLHPVKDVPELTPSSPLGGAYMMSPWARLRDTPAQVLKTDREGRGDFLTRRTGLYWASKVLEGVPESAFPYLDLNTAPEDWLKGAEKCVGGSSFRREVQRFCGMNSSVRKDDGKAPQGYDHGYTGQRYTCGSLFRLLSTGERSWETDSSDPELVR
ncbi:hypothetical protein BJ912DRAFT_41338 [Pholiota molesta]|nr:hypothetical protein BJ912DRAFT_41338 [Pholiota molesta]